MRRRSGLAFSRNLVNVEGVLELESYFATIIVKIGSSKNNQWMLSLGEKFLLEAGYFHGCKCLSVGSL